MRCTGREATRCDVTVRYVHTGLSPEGNEWVRAMDDARHAEHIEGWRAAIEAMLASRA